jgi:5-dehydro-2-deoxygluconokinase
MVEAIHQLLDAGVEPDVWNVEGLERRDDGEAVVAAARSGRRDTVGCIVLDRGASADRVRQSLGVAARVPGFIGFAVGRAVFWDALIAWRNGRATREATVAAIASRYRELVDTWSPPG